jgi:sarcosine oxidase subunit gamma
MPEFMDRSPVGHLDEPLSRAVLAGDGVILAERPREGLLLLCGPDTAAFRNAASQAIGLVLPGEACAVNMADGKAALWLSPGRWLIRSRLDKVAALMAALSRIEPDFSHLAVDVSHQYVVFSLTGWGGRAFLAKGCSLDLHPDKFASGHCASTLLGDLPLLIQQTDDTPGYDLIVDQSLARFALWWFTGQVS